jgi:DNA-binding transcriptional MocR family regulator
MADGGYDSHLKRQRKESRQQRDILADSIRRWPDIRGFDVPEGGLTLWVELKEDQDTSVLFFQLKALGIFIAPGALFSTKNKFGNYLRLSFAHPWNEHRQNALSVIGNMLDR